MFLHIFVQSSNEIHCERSLIRSAQSIFNPWILHMRQDNSLLVFKYNLKNDKIKNNIKNKNNIQVAL